MTVQIQRQILVHGSGGAGLIVPQHFHIFVCRVCGSVVLELGEATIGLGNAVAVLGGALKGIVGDMEDAKEVGPQGDHLFLHFFHYTGSFRWLFNLRDGEVLLTGVCLVNAVVRIVVVFDLFDAIVGLLVTVLHPGGIVLHAVDGHIYLVLGSGDLFRNGGFFVYLRNSLVRFDINLLCHVALDDLGIILLVCCADGTIQGNVIGDIGDLIAFGLNVRNLGVQIIGFLDRNVLFLGLPVGFFYLDGGIIFVGDRLLPIRTGFGNNGIGLWGKLHADSLVGILSIRILRLVRHGQIAAVAFGQSIHLGQCFPSDSLASLRLLCLLCRQLSQQLLPQDFPLLVCNIFRTGQAHSRPSPHGHAQHDHAQHQNQRQQP